MRDHVARRSDRKRRDLPARGDVVIIGGGITRLRGRCFELAVPGLDAPVPTLPIFHPAFLRRTPARKREACRVVSQFEIQQS